VGAKLACMGVVHQTAEQKKRAKDVEDAAESRGAEESHSGHLRRRVRFRGAARF
jgi:hypothetical protein